MKQSHLQNPVICHASAGWHPENWLYVWILAFAGMTYREFCKSLKHISLILVLTLFGHLSGKTSPLEASLDSLRDVLHNPEATIYGKGKPKTLGSSSWTQADIIFVPEMHDDPENIRFQMALATQIENQSSRPVILLSESLGSLIKSGWDFYSAKAVEYLAIQNANLRNEYTPKGLAQDMISVVENLSRQKGRILVRPTRRGLHAIKNLETAPKDYMGWDERPRGTLLSRNEKMVQTLKALEKKDAVLIVLAGARHIPDLDYFISLFFLCPNERNQSMPQFFDTIQTFADEQKKIPRGFGSTLPIYRYLKNRSYAIVMAADFLPKLLDLLNKARQKNHLSNRCFTMGKQRSKTP